MTYTGAEFAAKLGHLKQPAVGEPSPFWTAERCARLTLLWGNGRSASQIAKDIGCTRNQVIGKAHRMELKGRASPIIRASIDIWALTPHTCRYPQWVADDDPRLYCGRPSGDGPYCAAHQALTRLASTSYYEMERLRRRKPAEPR